MKKLITSFLLLSIFAFAPSQVAYAQVDTPAWLPMGDKRDVEMPTPEQMAEAVDKCKRKFNPAGDKAEQGAFWACLGNELGVTITENNYEVVLCTVGSLVEHGNTQSKSNLCRHWPGCHPCETADTCGAKYLEQDCCGFKFSWCMIQAKNPMAVKPCRDEETQCNLGDLLP